MRKMPQTNGSDANRAGRTTDARRTSAGVAEQDRDLAKRAREIWESEGRPDGRAERHWQLAELELEDSSRGFFERAIGCERTFDFVELLIDRHDFRQAEKEQWRDALSAIRLRAQDPNFYLAVVGEFSSGKSTLINAMLRRELLKSDVLQGTTAAATFIRFGPQVACESVEVELADGATKRPRCRNGETFRELVHRVTADEGHAREIERVRLTVPSPVGRDDFVIIDTPGLNAGNPRHAEVTERVVREEADAALILTPAHTPLSMVLCQFLREHLFDVLPRCALVVTQIDRLDAGERAGQVEYARRRFGGEFGVESPTALGVCASVVLLQHDRVANAERLARYGATADGFAAQFMAAEESLVAFVQSQRHIILAERLARLLEALLQPLSDALSRQEGRHKKRHEQLEKSRLPDLDRFAGEQWEKLTNELTALRRRAQDAAETWLRRKHDSVRRHMHEKLNAATDHNALDAVAKSATPELCNGATRELQEFLTGLAETAAKDARRLQSSLGKEFQALHESLAPLKATRTKTGPPEATAALDTGALHSQLSQVHSEHAAREESNNAAAGVGALGGAVLGQIMIPIPVVGAIIGAVVGAPALAKIFSFFQPGVDELRPKYRSDLDQALERIFEEVTQKTIKVVTGLDTSIRKGVRATLDRYRDEYGETVARLIAADDEEGARLAEVRKLVRKDLANVTRRLSETQMAKDQLRQAGNNRSAATKP